MPENTSEILIYQAPDGLTKVDVIVQNEAVWLTLNQLADLFQKAKSTISEHISNVYDERELDRDPTVRNFRTVQIEGNRSVSRDLEYYNLDVIISVGYRVKSHVGTHFRQWATQRLREYIIKGFALDDERLKQARNNYFDELPDRIRDIRSSEKVFYPKICDIFSTSIDYDPKTETSHEFFATVQNKFHYAIHGHTAAELVKLKADSTKPLMGLTSFPGSRLKKRGCDRRKNYLDECELKQLNLIVNQYLEFAQLQAMNRKPMHMADWIEKVHGFLTLNDREILTNAETVSKEDAKTHAHTEYEKFRVAESKQLANGEDELDKEIKRLNSQDR